MPEYAESWLQLEAATGGRSSLTGDANAMREQFAGLFALLAPHYPATPGVSTTNGSHEGIQFRLYTPKENAGKLLPIGIYTHGGGFVLGDLETDDVLCRSFVQEAETILVSVAYPLAPEHPYPAQLRDTTKILEWAHSNASSFGGDASCIYTIGTSAGSSLALLTAHEILRGRTSVPASCLQGVVAVCPVAVHPDHVPQEYKSMYSSYEEFGEGAPVISRAAMDTFLRCAKLDAPDSDGWILGHKEDFHLFPRVYVATASCDPLRDDSRVLAAAMKEAGVAVREKPYSGLPHCFWFFSSLPEWRPFVEDTLSAIRWIAGESED